MNVVAAVADRGSEIWEMAAGVDDPSYSYKPSTSSML